MDISLPQAVLSNDYNKTEVTQPTDIISNVCRQQLLCRVSSACFPLSHATYVYMCLCFISGDCGLEVTGDADWTHNVCGFWNVGLLELLLRSSTPGLSFIQWLGEFVIRVSIDQVIC